MSEPEPLDEELDLVDPNAPAAPKPEYGDDDVQEDFDDC